MAKKGIYVVNRQGMYLTTGRPERKNERVRWVRTKEEAGPCKSWVEADDLRMRLMSVNPTGYVEPMIVDNDGAELGHKQAQAEGRYHSRRDQR